MIRTINIFVITSLLIIFSCTSKEEKVNPDKDNTTQNTDQEDKDDNTEDDNQPEPTSKTPIERFGSLQVDGNKIIGKDEEPVQLRGMSFFWSQWIGKYYNTETVKWLKEDWRCTVVRAAMAIEHDGYLDNPEEEKNKIEVVIDAAIEEELYVIIDWHDHHAEDHQQEAKAFFGAMAKQYGDHPNIIYEPYNEPLDVSWSKVLKPYHEAIIDTIRAHDPDNLIICGTRNWSQMVSEPASDPIDDDNVAYTLHFYAATHDQWLRDEAKKALKSDLALMATEYGTTEASGDGYVDHNATKTWWEFLDKHSISWCNWSVADKDEASAALLPGAATTGGWDDGMISESGKLVREELIWHNPAP